MLKIIAGEYRSRQLLSPPDETVSRPYSQRVKEALFNRLRGWCEGARVLDLFAGVGTVGLEAVSRGASEVLLIERDRKVFRLLEENIAALECGDRARAVHADAMSPNALLRVSPPVDLVFVDPPYAMMREERERERVRELVTGCRKLMADESFLILRSPLAPDAVDLAFDVFDGPEAHRYGADMWVLFYAPSTGTDP